MSDVSGSRLIHTFYLWSIWHSHEYLFICFFSLTQHSINHSCMCELPPLKNTVNVSEVIMEWSESSLSDAGLVHSCELSLDVAAMNVTKIQLYITRGILAAKNRLWHLAWKREKLQELIPKGKSYTNTKGTILSNFLIGSHPWIRQYLFPYLRVAYFSHQSQKTDKDYALYCTILHTWRTQEWFGISILYLLKY